MFGPLAAEKHARQVASDHVELIREMAEDTISDENVDDEIDVEDLDLVMAEDTIDDEDIEKMDSLIGSVVGDSKADISSMTKDEITNHIAGVSLKSNELDS